MKQALSLHRKRPTSEVSTAHRPKRQCLSHWAAGLGAFQECDRAGKKLTPTVKKCGNAFGLASRCLLLQSQGAIPNSVLQSRRGEPSGCCWPWCSYQRVQSVGECIWGLAMLPNGEMIVGHGDADKESQLLSFQNGVRERSCSTVPRLRDVCCSPNGVIYVLDAGGTRVQKVEGSRLTPRCGQQGTFLKSMHFHAFIHFCIEAGSPLHQLTGRTNAFCVLLKEHLFPPLWLISETEMPVYLGWALCD